jgi:hypothetical protein
LLQLCDRLHGSVKLRGESVDVGLLVSQERCHAGAFSLSSIFLLPKKVRRRRCSLLAERQSCPKLRGLLALAC